MSLNSDAATTIEAFSDREVAPLVFDQMAPLRAEVFQTTEPVAYGEAIMASYRPVEPGWRWGPVWSNAWFRLTGTVPDAIGGRRICLRFSSGTEALLWDRGVPFHGLDLNHDVARLPLDARSSDRVTLYVEAACNRPLGATTFFWDDAAEVARWKEELPGRFDGAALVTVDEDVWRLRHGLTFAARVLRLLDAGDAHAAEMRGQIESAILLLKERGVTCGAREAMTTIRGAVRRKRGMTTTRCHAVGHAHIDTAWLWRLRETRRKCLRTFATALEMMERFPQFRFLCSQAQQYSWVERDSPELFARLRARVMQGRWEPGGAMWIEPDCNVPSGEALIRQVLHGTRYWRERFGGNGEQTYLYLPDTFGFPASLPQIIAQAGLRTFITNKLGWNETNEFPHSTFFWRGIDGTQVLSHCTPGMEYNSTLTPAELKKGESNHLKRDEGRTGDWLQPFGYGDGGGGPTDWMVLEAELASDCDGLPGVEFSDARSFCERLHSGAADLKARAIQLPVWEGELYLERHRGTYTTQAWIKRANRLAEESLRTAEWLACCGPRARNVESLKQLTEALDEAWKITLLNQFHDILPGSSIGEVYADARVQYERVRDATSVVSREAASEWGAPGQGEIVLNPASRPRSGVVQVGTRLAWVESVPALGVGVVQAAGPVRGVTVRGQSLENGIIAASIDSSGRVAKLRRIESGSPDAELATDGKPLNQLVLYDDNPKYWEAWDIDEDYLQHAHPVEGDVESWRLVEQGPLRAVIEVTRSLGESSSLTQRFTLEAGSPRLDVRTTVEWHEDRKLLRALFPTEIRAREATYGIQFGHLKRPTHADTSWDRAKFEVCAHRWADVSENGRGLAVLNDGKYGHSCRGGVLGLSLLRSTKFPDPKADMGRHEFTYSLMPHAGDWRSAGVDVEAESLNRPLMVLAGRDPHTSDTWRWAPFTLTGAGALGIEVAAIKPSESGDRVVVRFVETRGADSYRLGIDWHMRVGSVESVDVVERPRPSVMLSHDRSAQRTEFTIRPFEIVTLMVERV